MKSIALNLLTNKVLVSACAAWFVAQLLKVIFSFISSGYNAKRLVGGGGMPSSHGATVTALATATGITYGVGGFEFATTLFFAIIVIYDAMGVRMETGREAKVLNKMMRRDIEEGRKSVQERELNELMGHTLTEIIAGVIIGVLVAVLTCKIIDIFI